MWYRLRVHMSTSSCRSSPASTWTLFVPGASQATSTCRSCWMRRLVSVLPMHATALASSANHEQTHGQGESTTFQLSELPTTAADFVQTGEITLTIPLPAQTNFYRVSFSDDRVFLFGDAQGPSQTSKSMPSIKKGASAFLAGPQRYGSPIHGP